MSRIDYDYQIPRPHHCCNIQHLLLNQSYRLYGVQSSSSSNFQLSSFSFSGFRNRSRTFSHLSWHSLLIYCFFFSQIFNLVHHVSLFFSLNTFFLWTLYIVKLSYCLAKDDASSSSDLTLRSLLLRRLLDSNSYDLLGMAFNSRFCF